MVSICIKLPIFRFLMGPAICMPMFHARIRGFLGGILHRNLPRHFISDKIITGNFKISARQIKVIAHLYHNIRIPTTWMPAIKRWLAFNNTIFYLNCVSYGLKQSKANILSHTKYLNTPLCGNNIKVYRITKEEKGRSTKSDIPVVTVLLCNQKLLMTEEHMSMIQHNSLL